MPSINAWGSEDPVEVAKGGTGAPSLGDGFVLLGSGTSAITALDITAKGSLLVGDGTTDPVALTVGTNDFVLTADSAQASGLKWAAGGSGGSGATTLLASATASTSSSLDFSSFIDSTYNVYLFLVQDLVPDTNAKELHIRTSSDSGSNWDSGASDYSWTFVNSGGTFTSNQSDSKISLEENIGNTSPKKNTAMVWLYSPSATSTEPYFNYVTFAADGANNVGMGWGGGRRKGGVIINGVRFLMETGNITSGTIYMYGLTTPV